MWGLAEIVAAVVAAGLLLRLYRRIRELERQVETLDVGSKIRSDRLDIHAMRSGLLSRSQLDAIRSTDPEEWDKAALEVERHGLGIERESDPKLH